MRLRLLTLLIALGAGLALFGQSPSGVLSRTIRSEDWAINDWSAVRAGQFSVIHGRNGDELQVNALSTDARPAPPGRDRGAAPACDGNCFLVSAFDYGNRNRLGGSFGTFGSGTSTARATLANWADGRRALTIDFVHTASGPCGAWIHLLDFTRPVSDRVYLDATPLKVVTFWIRGATGAEAVLLKAADAAWERKEDALPIGEIGWFLPAGRITTAWQQAVVPLSALPGRLDRRSLAVLSFEVVSPGEGRIAIKDLGFCLAPTPTVPLSAPAALPSSPPPGELALWVWGTAEIIGNPAEQQALVEFARRGRFTLLFLQLPDAPARRHPPGDIVLDAARWKSFLGLLGRSGLRAHALAGSPGDALPDQHERVVATVQNVVAYNAAAAPGERFAGVHYDIEPYLLPGFRGLRRERILTGYLDLVARMAARARAARIEFGVDIPFWYDTPDGLTGELPLVEYHGVRKPASEHVLDLVDLVAVMTYRTTAYGADSIVGLADGELTYAAAKGKRVFIGLETGDLPDEDLVEFDGEPGRGLPERVLADRAVVIARGPGTGTAWLGSRADWHILRTKLGAAESGLADAPPLWWPVRRVVAVPATKLTFARLGAAPLNDTMRQVLLELGHRRSFAGFAVHDYLGYRALLAGSRPPG